MEAQSRSRSRLAAMGRAGVRRQGLAKDTRRAGNLEHQRFDITAALKAGDNQFTILCDHHHLNELGTGGLMGPVVLYREK